MRYAKIFLISLLLLILCTSCVVSASEDVCDENLTVENHNMDLKSNNGDSISDTMGIAEEDALQSTVTVSGNDFDDIENAIDGANKGDTIKLTGTYSGDGSYIYITKSVTIQGSSATNKATLDAKGLSSIIMADAKVTFKNIIFKNANDYAIHCSGISSFQNCIFENNGGYGITCWGSDSSSLTVKNSIFDNNGGGISNEFKKMTIENSNFTNNKDSAINMDPMESLSYSVSIKNSRFSNNFDEYEGGALYFKIYDGYCIVDSCKFENNKANNNAGAISFYSNNAIINISDSTFSLNNAYEDSSLYLSCNGGNLKNNVFVNNKARDDIAGIGYVFPKIVMDNNIVKSSEGISENLKLEFLKNPSFYGDIVKVKFSKGNNALSNKKIHVVAFNVDSLDKVTFDVVTDSNGIAKFALASRNILVDVGVWDIQFIADSGNSKLVASSNNLNIKKLSAKLILNGFSTTYTSGKAYSLKLVNNDNSPAGNIGLQVTVYKNGWYLKNYLVVSDLNGIANVKLSGLDAGNYKITISSDEMSSVMSLGEKSASIKINKAPTKVKAPKVTNKYKKSQYFKVTVKAYNKPLKNVKVKVKVFTGKKSKKYTINTNKKGVSKLNTKKLSKGSHKVVISSGNKNYKISAKSKIKIK